MVAPPPRAGKDAAVDRARASQVLSGEVRTGAVSRGKEATGAGLKGKDVCGRSGEELLAEDGARPLQEPLGGKGKNPKTWPAGIEGTSPETSFVASPSTRPGGEVLPGLGMLGEGRDAPPPPGSGSGSPSGRRPDLEMAVARAMAMIGCSSSLGSLAGSDIGDGLPPFPGAAEGVGSAPVPVADQGVAGAIGGKGKASPDGSLAQGMGGDQVLGESSHLHCIREGVSELERPEPLGSGPTNSPGGTMAATSNEAGKDIQSSRSHAPLDEGAGRNKGPTGESLNQQDTGKGPMLMSTSWSAICGGNLQPAPDLNLRFISPVIIDGIKTAVCPSSEKAANSIALAIQIVNECDGLPLAIITIGRVAKAERLALDAILGDAATPSFGRSRFRNAIPVPKLPLSVLKNYRYLHHLHPQIAILGDEGSRELLDLHPRCDAHRRELLDRHLRRSRESIAPAARFTGGFKPIAPARILGKPRFC